MASWLWRPFIALVQIERGAWTILVSVLFLAIGFSFPWYSCPSTLHSGFDRGEFRIESFEPPATIALRLLTLIVAAILLFTLFRGERARFAFRIAPWLLLTAVLMFPPALPIWEPEVALDGAILWNSLDEMIWTEMDHSYENQQTVWHRDDVLIQPGAGELQLLERPLAGLFPVPSGAGGGFGPEVTIGRSGSALLDGLDMTLFRSARLPEVFSQLFGYSNAFLNLAGKGWFFSLMGSVVAIIGIYVPGSRGPRAFRRDIRWLAPGFVVALAALMAPHVYAESHLIAYQQALARGDNQLAERHLRTAARWRPVLNYYALYQSSLGQLTRARNCGDCAETLLSLSFDALNASRFPESIDYVERFARRFPDRQDARYWIGLVYTQAGVHYYQNGEDSVAAEDWWKALQFMPTSAWPLWGLALVQLHMRQFDAAERSVRQIVDLQKTIFWKRLPATSQWYGAEAWAAFRRGDTARAHDFYSLSLTPEDW